MKKQNNLDKKIRKESKNIIFNIVFMILNLLFVILFYKSILVTTSLLALLTIIGLIKRKSKLTIVIFVFGAFFGAIAEMTAINYNVWFYSVINFLNVPAWLFILWGNAACSIYQTAIEFERLGVHK